MVRPDPKRAKKLVELGTKEEDAGSYEAALSAYDEAVRYSPFDLTIVGKAAALRSKLIHAYVDNAEKLAVEGNLQGATQQLAAALHIDPNNDTLQERLKQMESMRNETRNTALEEPAEGLPQICSVQGNRRTSISKRICTGAYEQVASTYGLKVSFDPDLPARNVKLRLDDVDFDTAMKVLALETGTFWKPLNSKLIFVAADTTEKRKAFDTVIEQTFVLPDSVSSTEMADVVKVVRDLTGAQRVQQSANAHSLTIRDTIPRVHLAGAIIKDLEQAPGEVLLEFQFLEVDRNKAMQLGITPPASFTVYSVPPNLAQRFAHRPQLYRAPDTLGFHFWHRRYRRHYQSCFRDSSYRGLRWRQDHLSSHSPERVRRLFRIAFAGPERTAGAAASRRRQTRYLFCRPALSHHTFLAVRKLGHRRPHSECGWRCHHHDWHATIHRGKRPGRFCLGGSSRQWQSGSRRRQPGGQFHHDPAESRHGSCVPVRSSNRFADRLGSHGLGFNTNRRHRESRQFH